MKKSELRAFIQEYLKEEAAGAKILQMKIKNPETGNDIKLKSALAYPEDSQVYKAAKSAHQKAMDIVSKDTGDGDSGEEEEPKAAGKPESSSGWDTMKKSKGTDVPAFWDSVTDVGDNPSHEDMAGSQEAWLTDSNGARDQEEAVWAHFNDAMTSNDAARQEGAMSAIAQNMLDPEGENWAMDQEEYDDQYNDYQKAQNQEKFVDQMSAGAKQTFKTIPGEERADPKRDLDYSDTKTESHPGYGSDAKSQAKSFAKMAAEAAQRSKDAAEGGDKKLAKSFKKTAANAVAISKFLSADHGEVPEKEDPGTSSSDADDDDGDDEEVDYEYDEDGDMINKKTGEPMGPRESTEPLKLKDLIRR